MEKVGNGNIRMALLFASMVTMAFTLGWHMRGDKIYGGMFEQQVNNIGTMLPVKGDKNAAPK